MHDVLSRITKYKKEEIAAAKVEFPWEDVVAKAHDATPVRGFLSALKTKRANGEL